MAVLGIRFKPDDQQAELGKRQARKEGGGLQQTIQMLSLRYPKMLGARSPVGDPALLAGNTPRLSGFNPDAAILQAMIRALSGGGPMTAQPGAAPGARGPRGVAAAPRPSRAQTAPSFTPGIDAMGAPKPSGPVTREWDSPKPAQTQGTLVGQASGELQEAASRASRGYNPQDRYDFYNNTSRGFLP